MHSLKKGQQANAIDLMCILGEDGVHLPFASLVMFDCFNAINI